MTDNRPVVFIVEDDDSLRETIVTMVESVDLSTQSYPSGTSFLEAYDRTQPGCLILDVRLPGLSGTEVLRELRERGSTIPAIVTTGFADVPIAVEMMKRGAVDFLEKPFGNQELLNLVQKCVASDVKHHEDAMMRQSFTDDLAGLSVREKEVFHLIVRGHANKSIAGELNINIKTVEAHRSNFMKEMSASSFAELVERATRFGSTPGQITSRSD